MAMATFPVDIPPSDEASAHTGHTAASYGSYGGLAHTDAAADATTPAVYQSSVVTDAHASAPSPRHGRRAGALAAGASLAAMALVVAGVVTGSQTNAVSGILGTSNALVEEATAGTASAANIAKVATSAPSAKDNATDYSGMHVMFILVDDMGYNDIGYQSTDTPYSTETLNHYASTGVRLKNYYTQSSCTPARVAILTGRYPTSVGMGYDGAGSFVVDSPYGIPLEFDLMGRHFSKGGYRTAFIGKWNVGHVEENYLPHRRGFDSSIMYNSDAIHYYNYTASPNFEVTSGYYSGNKSYVTDMLIAEANSPFKLATDAIGTYTSTLFTDRAMAEFAKTTTDKRSLFLYLAFQSVHVPHSLPPNELFDTTDEWKLKSVETHNRYHFGRTAVAMDRSIKRLMDHIEALGLSDNLLMAIASDNGACPTDGGNNYPMRGGKFQSYEGGVHVPSFIWSGAMETSMRGTSSDVLFHAIDWLPTLAKASGALTDEELTVLDIDGMDMGDQILHGVAGSSGVKTRTELLLHLNCWEVDRTDTLQVLNFSKSYTSMIYTQDDHQWKIHLNSYKGYRLEPSHSSYNESCFSSVGPATDYLFDLNKDPYEETNLKDARPDVFMDLQLKLRKYYDAARTPAWSAPEEDLAYAAWESSVGGDGFVTPWHRPQADVYQGKDDDGNSEQLTNGASGSAVHPMA